MQAITFTKKWDWNKSGPVRIMKMDGKWVSYDNRCLMGAQQAGLENIPYKIVSPGEYNARIQKNLVTGISKTF